MSATGRLSYHLTRRGQLNLAGASSASKNLVEELLLKDANEHHCFFRRGGFHNHLSHRTLAAYDLGAPPELLRKMYTKDAVIQRRIILEEADKNIVLTTHNWTQYLGNQNAYAAFVKFFSEEIEKNGVAELLATYIFDDKVDGVNMLTRIMSGALHPIIHIGYGVEFGLDTLVATGLSEAAVQNIIEGTIFQIDKSAPEETTSLLELLRRVYASPALEPGPYNPNRLINDRVKDALSNGGKEELERLCALYHIPDNISPTDIQTKIEEIMFVATLLFAGTGRRGRKPRLDFFLMHILTSSIFLKPICGVLEKAGHKAALIRAYVVFAMMFVLTRGRPKIDAVLAMSYTSSPRPAIFKSSGDKPFPLPKPSPDAIGNPWRDEDYNPWPSLIEGCMYHSEPHLIKAMRTLYFAAREYGDKPAGSVPGAWRNHVSDKEETHVGIGQVDGTVFVRAAGVMMDTLGWSGHGQTEGDWDRSALGWDAAWEIRD